MSVGARAILFGLDSGPQIGRFMRVAEDRPVVRWPRQVTRDLAADVPWFQPSRARAEAQCVPARRDKALVTIAGLVGALMLSRVVDDPKISDDILEAAATTFGRA
jgi:hypothetical protein